MTKPSSRFGINLAIAIGCSSLLAVIANWISLSNINCWPEPRFTLFLIGTLVFGSFLGLCISVFASKIFSRWKLLSGLVFLLSSFFVVGIICMLSIEVLLVINQNKQFPEVLMDCFDSLSRNYLYGYVNRFWGLLFFQHIGGVIFFLLQRHPKAPKG